LIIQKNLCHNLNHGRINAPVRFCPLCGEVVNGKIATQLCNEEKHDKARRTRNKYCIDCSEQLISGN